MKYTAILSALMIAGAVATPLSKGAELRHKSRSARKENRAAGKVLKTGPRINSTLPSTEFVEYSENWAGAVISTTKVTSVTGTATVPSVSSGDGAAWV